MMRNWLKLASQEGAEKVGKAEKLWRIRKSEKVGFKAQKKLIVGERKCPKRMGRSRSSDLWSRVCQEQRILDF